MVTGVSTIAAILALTATCAVAGRYTRADFDRCDAAWNGGNGAKAGLGDSLAWGESYLMLSYVEMYRATRDTHYLDKLVDHADHVLANRDDNRGFRDYSGRSRPAWSVAGAYTVAELVINNSAGKPCLKLRSTPYAYNDQTNVYVEPHPDGTFDLSIDNAYWKRSEEYKGVSMDRSSPSFVERRVNAKSWVPRERKLEFSDKGSGLVTVEAVSDQSPEKITARLKPLSMAYHGYSGMITLPMLEFAMEVRVDARLAAKYGKIADRYIAEVAKVFKDADEEWRDGPQKHEGYYVFGSRGCPFWSDNVPKPFNYLGSEALCLLRLGQLTGDRHWTARASAVARLLKRHLTLADNGAYVWRYWWGPIEKGWTRDDSPSLNTPTYGGSLCVEDTSHGALELQFVCACAEAGVVFDAEDMRRFAKTFLLNVVDMKAFTMNNAVDGEQEKGQHDAMVGYWMELAKWEPRVASVGLRIAERLDLGKGAAGSGMLTLARAIRHGGTSK